MRMANSNKRKLKYSLLQTEMPVYDTNPDGSIKFVEKDGVQIAVETGEMRSGYADPVDFLASLSMSGGESEETVYGIDVSAYDATIVTAKGLLPIDETSIIWYKSVPKKKGGFIDENSADYKVVKVVESLNYTKYVLAKVVK